MSHRSSSLLLLTLALVACAPDSSQMSHPATLGTAITLAPAQRAVFSEQGLEVQFVAVVEDSRCPRDVTCVWAGEVKVQLAIRSKSAASAQHEILEGRGVTVGEYRVSVLEVRPEALSGRKILAEEYRVTIKVERG